MLKITDNPIILNSHCKKVKCILFIHEGHCYAGITMPISLPFKQNLKNRVRKCDCGACSN